jgi:uncharacterized protein (TIGR03083 family)
MVFVELDDLDPFAIFDAEAARLDRYFSGLSDEAWLRESRCAGWTVRDVLAHLAGEEAYNHACLDDDLDGLAAHLEREGIRGVGAFNDWTVRTRRDWLVSDVLAEWRRENGDTRYRMRMLGRDAILPTMSGPYPVGLQAFHYASEYATHADDIGVPDSAAPARVRWRFRVGAFALTERGAPVTVFRDGDGDGTCVVTVAGVSATLTPSEFIAATVGRLPEAHSLDPRIRAALRCLA